MLLMQGEGVLSSYVTCPCFTDLPRAKELSPAFFQFRFDGFPTPSRHWVFMGEIVDDAFSSYKQYDHRTTVADRRGERAPLCFFYEKDAPCTFKFKQLKKGNTVFVMYAEVDDLKVENNARALGVRVDSLDYATVVSCPLATVLRCASGDAECLACKKNETKLLRCSQCRVVRFCDAACQKKAWPRHKAECEELGTCRAQVQRVVDNVSGPWCDEYRPFPIDKLAVPDDFFGKGNTE